MNSVEFDTILKSSGENTGIEIPNKILETLGVSKRQSLMISVNGYEYQCTPGTINGKTVVSFSSEHRKKTSLKGGEQIHIQLRVAVTPKKVEMPAEFLKALKISGTDAFFTTLSNSLQRYHCDLINAAKTEETKQKRIQKAVNLFLDGKKR